VQSLLHRAVIRVVKHPVTLVGSSRTDAGVHAKGQVAHFDAPTAHIPPEGLRRAINSGLPESILVRKLELVDPDFHAIRWTTSKRYQYVIYCAEDRPVFNADLYWHRWQKLDVARMRQAAALMVGTHDFASFAKPTHTCKTTIRTVLSCEVSRVGSRMVIGVEGTGFMWNMVRIMVGTLVEIGMGRIPVERVTEMLAARDRQAAGPTAPPHGLYLQWIKFARPLDSTEIPSDD
jgi:tRNA pseudouridine38-40 synthase